MKYKELTHLNLNDNELINLDFIKKKTQFINLIYLNLNSDYNLRDITNIKYLPKLNQLDITGLKLIKRKETMKIIKTKIYPFCLLMKGISFIK